MLDIEWSPAKKPWMEDYDFILIQNIEKLEEVINQAIESGLCSFDLESTGLDTRVYNGKCKSYVVGYCISFEPKKGYYIPIRHSVETTNGKNLDPELVNPLILKLVNNCSIVGHAWLKYDWEMLYASEKMILKEINLKEKAQHDTYIMARLAGKLSSGLKQLSKNLLDKEMIGITDVVKVKNKKATIDFGSISPYEGLLYAASDPICTLELFNYPEFQKTITDQGFIYGIERKLQPVVRRMERNLVKLNVDHTQQLNREMTAQTEKLEDKIFKYVEEETKGKIKEFKLDSPDEVANILFNEFDMEPKPEKGKKGNYKTDDKVLTTLAPRYPLAKDIQEYRSVTKFHRTYIKNMILNVDENGYLKFNFRPLKTDSGRFASPGREDAGEGKDGYSGVNIQCLGGDSRILVKDKGFIRIKDVGDRKIEVWDGEKFVKAQCVYSGKKKKVILKFFNSQEFVCSPDHKFLTIPEDGGNTRWRKVSEFNKREYVVRSSEVSEFNKREYIVQNFEVSDLNTKPLFDDSFVKSAPNKKFVSLNNIENLYEVGILLGRFASDGTMQPSKSVTWLVAEHEYNISSFLESILAKMGKYWVRYPEKKGCQKTGEPFRPIKHLTISSAHLAEQFERLNLKKTLPDIIWSSKELLRGFLCGYFDGDGGISGNIIALTFAGNDLKLNYGKLIQKALFLFGINSGVKRYKSAVRLYIRKRFQKDFAEKIGFINKKKQEKLLGLSETSKISHKIGSALLVKEVIETNEYVDMYDVVGSPSERFMADGFIVHNSTPARYDKTKPNVRKCITCEDDEVIAALDWSGVEIRVATNMSKEPIWTDKFINGNGDVHTATAAIIFGVKESDVTKTQRQFGKTINFQTLYGGGPGALAAALGITVEEAKMRRDRFFKGLKVLHKWIKRMQEEAKKNEYCLTAFGRKRFLPNINSDDPKKTWKELNKSVNTPVQGSAADLLKIAMIQIDKYLEKNNLRDSVQMLITMHDELVFRIKKNKIDIIPEIVKVMELKNVVKKKNWKVPLKIDAEVGRSWDVEYEYDEMLEFLKVKKGKEKVADLYTLDYGETLKEYKEFLKEKKAKKYEKKEEPKKDEFKKTVQELKLTDKPVESADEISVSACEVDKAFTVLKEAKLENLSEEAYKILKKNFYETEYKRLMEGIPSSEDDGISVPVVVHKPIDDAKKNLIGFLLDSCRGRGKVKLVTQDEEELHDSWLDVDLLKFIVMSKIFNL